MLPLLASIGVSIARADEPSAPAATVLMEPADSQAGALAVIPFGVAHFVWGKPGRGIVYAGTQAVGLTGTVFGSVQGAAALEADDDEAMQVWQIVTGASVALLAGSYMTQMVDGSRLAEQRAAQPAVAAFDRALHPFLPTASLPAGRPTGVLAPPASAVAAVVAIQPSAEQ